MINKIKSITEKVPKETTLPDGYYNGIWGGYIIEISCSNKKYELTTEEGTRGINVKVVVEVIDGIATFGIIRS